ncbi:MAG: hypothetical protein OXP71_11175 [Candidatus Poribacteria bacterium]|nr:hypothetical protein [Candidatus Poribacteria bacterium]
MKKSELWESIILLFAAILLLPIWLLQSDPSRLSEGMFRLGQILQGVLLVTLVVILVRRVRRVVYALRNKNRR